VPPAPADPPARPSPSAPPLAPGPSVVLGPPLHPCRLGPVVREVGRYLAGDDASPREQRHAAAHAFRNAQADFEAFRSRLCDGTTLTAMELSIRGGGRDLLSVSTHLPSPLTLLLVCTRNCEDGDVVAVRQRTAKCGSLLQEARWPFGLAEAERLTRPASVLFHELQVGARAFRFGRAAARPDA
jgi:hypothetical protein